MAKNHPPGEPHRWVRVGGNRLPDGSLTPTSWECHCGAKQKKRPEPFGTYDIRTGKYVRKMSEAERLPSPDFMKKFVQGAREATLRNYAKSGHWPVGISKLKRRDWQWLASPEGQAKQKEIIGRVVYPKSQKEWNTYVDRSVQENKWNTYQKVAPVFAKQMGKPFRVKTKEGPVEGKAGDYLCVGVEAEMWPVDKTIFEKTMKKVESGAPRLKEIIQKHGSGYRLVSHKGKNLGDFSTKAAAEKHEREVEWFKKHK